MAVVESHDADVVVLQEVQLEYAAVALQDAMEERGYAGRVLRKTGENDEGVAVYYKSELWECVEEKEVSLNSLSSLACETVLNIDPAKARMLTDNVALAVFLRHKIAPYARPICITAYHGYWNWMQCDVQTLHLALLLNHLDALVAEREASLVLAGDYNLLPDSPGYHLLTTGALDPASHRDALTNVNPVMVGLGDDRAIDPETNPYQHLYVLNPDLFSHSLSLTSAYAAVLGSEPETTNYTDRFSGTLDYICTTPGLDALAVRSVPGFDQLGDGCPNTVQPSDHLPISAQISLCDDR